MSSTPDVKKTNLGIWEYRIDEQTPDDLFDACSTTIIIIKINKGVPEPERRALVEVGGSVYDSDQWIVDFIEATVSRKLFLTVKEKNVEASARVVCRDGGRCQR